MYLPYKIILGTIIGAIIFGIGYLVWTRLPEGMRAKIVPGGEPPPIHQPGDVDPPPVAPPREGDGGTRAAPHTERSELERLLSTAEMQLEKQSYVAARTLARKVMSAPEVREFDPSWRRAAEVITKAHAVLFNSTTPDPEKAAHRIRSGDSLARIARDYRTTVGALQRINALDRTDPTIYENEVLYCYKGDWRIVVSKANYTLLLMDGDKLFMMYPVGIGRQDRTPVGTFEITTKKFHPPWTYRGRTIEYGHPENVLGTHWMGFTPTGDTDSMLIGYGIHGTWQPETIGQAASNGCIRMRNPVDGADVADDIGELFDLIPEPVSGTTGVQVIIRDE